VALAAAGGAAAAGFLPATVYRREAPTLAATRFPTGSGEPERGVPHGFPSGGRISRVK
jgi:hypothetical protein